MIARADDDGDAPDDDDDDDACKADIWFCKSAIFRLARPRSGSVSTAVESTAVADACQAEIWFCKSAIS